MCALNLEINGSEDKLIHSLKKEGTCPNGDARLKEALQIIFH